MNVHGIGRMKDPSRADELEQRLIAFGAEILSLSAKLPRTPQGRHVALQMLRAGTATAANYGEARGAESRSDFVHKLRVVLKELNETGIWLQMIGKSALIPAREIVALVAENHELSRIIAASVRTARANQ
jgi:four helix bundle protein